MNPRILQSVEEIRGLAGQVIGVSDWLEVSQERIRQFADATGDHQWIHVDAGRAAEQSPYKTTIAHGFLSLSLLPALGRQVVRYGDGFRMTINYGLNRVRFPSAVRSGTRIRGRFRLASVSEFEGGAQLCWDVTVEAENSEKPCLVAEWLSRVYR